MAARESDSGEIKKEELQDITTCSICTDIFTDPKVLPCIHAFCMKCIQQIGLKTNKRPGDEMPCPVCRRQFKIPPEGFRGLRKNFFIERLIQLANISDPSKALCSVCLEESTEETSKKIPAADVCCLDCKHKLCEQCCNEHKQFKLTKNHKLIPITEHEADENLMADPVPSVCELHERNVLNVYCADCKAVVCAICFIESHNNHRGSHVNKLVDGFRKQIESNAEAVLRCSSETRMIKAKLLKKKEAIQQQFESLEKDISQREDEIKQLTENHAYFLLQDLCLIRQRKLKEIQMTADDIDAHLLYLESYNTYCQRIMAKGSASDICSSVSDLSLRAVELQQQCQPLIEREILSFKLCLRNSEFEKFLEEDRGNLIGQIEEEGDSKQKKRSKQGVVSEQSNENDFPRKEIEIESAKKLSFLLMKFEQLRIKFDTEVQATKALKEEVSKATIEKASYNAQLEKLKEELNNKEVIINILQANNEELMLEQRKEFWARNSLQGNFLQKEKGYKTKVKVLEAKVEELRQEFGTAKADKLQFDSDSDPGLDGWVREKIRKEKKKSSYGINNAHLQK